MKIVKLFISTFFLLAINIQFINAQQVDVKNRVEFLEEGQITDGLSSIKALALNKRINKKKKITKRVVKVKRKRSQEPESLESFFRKVSKKSKSLRFRKKRREVEKCFKDTSEESNCGSN